MREGWTPTRVSSLLTRSIGGVWGAEPGTDQEEVTVVRSTEFTKNGILNFATGVTRSIKSSQLSSRELAEGDILLEKSGGGPEQPVGRVVYVHSTIPTRYVCSNFIQLLTPSKEKVLPRFLFLVMWQWHFENKTLEYQAQTTGIRNLRTPDYLEQLIALPPLVEQRRIVDLIAAVDSYIAALQQQADAARSARSAVIEQVLVDGDDKWGNVSMGEVLEIAGGGSPRPIHDYITTSDDGVNWIKIGDAATHDKYIYATSQKIRPEGVNKSRRVFPGDFLLSNSMSFGRPYILRTDGCIHDGWLLLSGISKHFDEDYLYNVLMSNRVQQQFNSLAAGSGVRNLNIDVASEVRIPLPPIDIQKEIGSLANSFDALVLSTEQTLAVAIELRAGVVSELLSGAHEIPESYDRLLGAA